jgi:predicted nucleic acid-binding protein
VFLLDTNVVSELRKVGTAGADRPFESWAKGAEKGRMWVSSITTLELEIGVRRLERKDRRQGKVLRQWFSDQVLPAFEGRILAFDHEAALLCATYHVPDPRPDRDSFIAAIAQVHGLTIVTRNVADFEPLGVALLNPWLPLTT